MNEIFPVAKRPRMALNDHDNHVIDSLSKFRMEELFNPVMVSLFVGRAEAMEIFKIQRELLVKHSMVLDKQFPADVEEGEVLEVDMPEVKPQTFKAFMTFVFIHSLAGSLGDSTELTFAALFDLWIFGEQYQCKRLLQHVLETVQVKTIVLGLRVPEDGSKAGKYDFFPSADEVTHLYSNTTGDSPLRRLLVDLRAGIVADARQNENEDAFNASFPADFLAACLSHTLRHSSALLCEMAHKMGGRSACSEACKGHKPEDFNVGVWATWCRWHEHENKEEQTLCEWRREALYAKLMTPPAAEENVTTDIVVKSKLE